ncbi:MAG: hypothetical protein V1837_04650 [Candidatus Woesearchaeota archaeon]
MREITPKGYPYTCLEHVLKGSSVKVVGVNHEMPFFFSNLKNLCDLIDCSAATVIEQPTNCEFWEVPFFAYLGAIAAVKKRRVFVCDPLNEPLHQTELNLWAAGFPLTLIGFEGMRRNLSRRDFVKSGITALLGAAFLNGQYPMLYPEIFTSKRIDALPSHTGWGVFDYRNTIIAQGLSLLRERFDSVTVFHGETHCNAISRYVEHDFLRLKRFLYYPLKLYSSSTMREYKVEGLSWKLVSEEKLL